MIGSDYLEEDYQTSPEINDSQSDKSIIEKILKTHPFTFTEDAGFSETQQLLARRLANDMTITTLRKDPEFYATNSTEELKKSILPIIEDNQVRAGKIVKQLEKVNKLRSESVIKASKISNKQVSSRTAAFLNINSKIGSVGSNSKIFAVILHAPRAAKASSFFGIAATVTEFLIVGSLYLIAFARGKKPPKISSKQKLAYLGVSIGLIIMGVLAPPVAGVIGAVGASFSFIYTVYSVANIYREKFKAKKFIGMLKIFQDESIADIIHLKDDLHTLEAQLDSEVSKELPVLDKVEAIVNELEQLTHMHDKKIEALGQIKTDLFYVEKNFDKTYVGTEKLFLQGLGFAVASAALVSAGLAFSLPFVAFIISATTAAIGLCMLVTNVVYRGISTYFPSKEQDEESEKLLEHQEEVPQDHQFDSKTSLHLQSTAKLMKDLYGDKAKSTLRQLIDEEVVLCRVDLQLSRLVSTKNFNGILHLFITLAETLEKAYQEEKAVHPDSQLTMDDFCQKLENFKPAVELFAEAIVQVKQGLLSISVQDKAALSAHPEFAVMLQESHGVDVFSLKEPLSSSGRVLSEDSALEP